VTESYTQPEAELQLVPQPEPQPEPQPTFTAEVASPTEVVTETAQPTVSYQTGLQPQIALPLEAVSQTTTGYTGQTFVAPVAALNQTDLIVHSQRNCLYIDPTSMSRLQNEVAVSRLLQPGLYSIKLKSGTFDYQIQSGHAGEPLVLLWVYGGKVVNQKTGVEVGATWSSLNGYGDMLLLRVIEPATLCGFFFDTYLDDNEGAVVVSVEGPGYRDEISVDSKHNCYFIDPETMRRLEQETSVSRTLSSGTYVIRIKSGAFGYRSQTGHQGEPIVLLWIYGGKVVNRKTGIEVAATWISLNGYSDMLTLEVREPATICAFFFDTYLEDNAGEVMLSLTRV